MKPILKLSLLLTVLCVIFAGELKAQVELVPVTNSVYSYLRRLQNEGVITGYNPAALPISRNEVAKFLLQAENNRSKISKADKQFLDDYIKEFEYDMYGTVKNKSRLIGDGFKDFVSDKKQKYLYYYTDTSSAFFLDMTGMFNRRDALGDDKRSITLLEGGFRFRMTLYKTVGAYLRLSNGVVAKGETADRLFAAETDPFLGANTKFTKEGKNFDSFEGHLRYQTEKGWLGLTLGREAVLNGFGYIDKLFLSNNTVPYDFAKLDLKYKIFNYSFLYGSIQGDSLGQELNSKNIVTHRLDLNFSDVFRMGLWESVITSNQGLSFTYLNPVSFITSADLNTNPDATYRNNALLGIDFEARPVKNLSFQGSLLIDDLNFETVFKSDSSSFDNKFGYQFGAFLTTKYNIDIAAEYTRLNPFVYTHRSNKNTFTHHGYSLGHALPPNSDEIALRLNYTPASRLLLSLKYRHQRSGGGYEYNFGSSTNYNYGGDINRGDGDWNNVKFLDGTRTDRDIINAFVSWQFIRQYFLEFSWEHRIQNTKPVIFPVEIKTTDNYLFATFRIDY